jgi:TPR repeat protein
MISMTPRHIAIAATVLVTLLAVFQAPAAGAAIEGEVISIQGDTLNILVRSGPAPAVGDTVTVMNRPDENGNATLVGEWRVTEVRGSDVKAVLVQRHGGEPSEGMTAHFTSSRGPGFREGPDVDVPGSASSGVPGTVTEVRGEDVTIRLEREATPAVGDRVELSYAAGEDTISLGTWRVTGVRADGRVDAEPEDVRGQPTPRMDALVFATGKKPEPKAKQTKSGVSGGQRANEIYAEAIRIQPTDAARAVALMVEAAEMGHAEAAERAAIAYATGNGVPREDVRAAALFRQAAEAGRPEAQNWYGSFFGTGRGVAEDQSKAVFWFQRAAEGGEAYAQANLCIRHQTGNGADVDLEKALSYCRKSAAQNNSTGWRELGRMYQEGLGVEKDLTEAFRCYQRAAELGYAIGQNDLGCFYEMGWGVTRDYRQALHWYRKAASQSESMADWNLGRMYNEGNGVTRDEAQAIEHWKRAARAGHTVAQEKLKELGQTW